MAIRFNGIGEIAATFSGACEKGDIVTLSAPKTAVKAAAGQGVCGVCVSKGTGIVGVCVGGMVTVAYTGTAPVVGYAELTAAGGNAVKVAATGDVKITRLVVDVDTVAKTATILL